MPKFFVKTENINGNNIIINNDDAKHIFSVLRLKIGDSITVCDGKENDFECKILSVSSKEVLCTVNEVIKCCAEPHTKITLFQGIPKSDKMETIIQKCVELGIYEIVPVVCKRTVVKLENSQKEIKKLDRWNKISKSAAEQAGRGIIPIVNNIVSFKEAVDMTEKLDKVIFFYEKEEQNNIKSFLKDFKGKSVGVFIGPEGGFDIDEVEYALNKGFYMATFGKRILRTETAGIAAVSILIYELG